MRQAIRLGEVTTFDIRSLSQAQRRVLDQCAIGEAPFAAKKTLGVLLEKGYLIEHKRMMAFHDGLPAMEVSDYEVPLAVHWAWAAACSEEIEAEEAKDQISTRDLF